MTKAKTDLELATDHKYRLRDGRIAVSVTAISGLLDDGKSGAFAGAAVKLAREGRNYREEWKAKAERGSRIHGHLEKWLKHEDIDVAPDEEGYVDALETFIADKSPEVIQQERIVLSDHGYGGRFDLICGMEGGTWLLDAKTGNPYAVEHTLQLAAYRYADGMATYLADGSLADLEPMPHIDHTGCLYVKEDGTYRIMEYPANRIAWDQFLALLGVHQWSRSTPIKAVVKASRG